MNTKRRPFAPCALVFLSVAVLLLAACESGKPDEAKSEPKLGRPQALAPQARPAALIYRQLCAGCHGSYGAGDGSAMRMLTTRPRDWTVKNALAGFTDQQLLEKILDGSAVQGNRPKPMPAFDEALLPEEAKALVQYARDLENVKIPERPR